MENKDPAKETLMLARLASARERWKFILAAVFFTLIIIFAYLIFPLLDGIVIGIILAYVARPIKKYLDRYLPKISSLVASLVIILPIFIILGIGLIEISNGIIWFIKNYQTVIMQLISVTGQLNLPGVVQSKIEDIILNFTSYLLPVLKEIPLLTIAEKLAIFFINVSIAIVECYFLLQDGHALVEKMLVMTPPNYERFIRKFITHLDMILSAIFVGNAYGAIAVAIFSLIVFYIFGIPNSFAMASLMLIAAVVPILTGWMVIVPLTLYKYYESGPQSALIFLAASVAIIIIPPEFILRPYLINVQSNIHPLLIIIAFIGGGLIGGIAGFFTAPILLGIIVAAYRAYAEEVDLTKQEEIVERM